MKIERKFTIKGESPYKGVTFKKVKSEIRNPDGVQAAHAKKSSRDLKETIFSNPKERYFYGIFSYQIGEYLRNRCN